MKVMPTGNGSVNARSSLRRLVISKPEPVAVGEPVETDVSACPEGAWTVLSAGQVMVGAGTSITVTLKVQLPPPVVEVAVTNVVPIAKNDPEAWLVFTVPQSPNA